MSFGAPPSPDYKGAAESEAAASQQNLTQQTWANRPNTYTPWGSQTWSSSSQIDPSTGQAVTSWDQNINLTPEQQKALDSQQRIQAGRSGIAESLLGQAGKELGAGMDWSSMPAAGQYNADPEAARNAAEDALYKRQASRLDPQWTQRQDQTRTQLYNQGLREGDPAFDSAMQEFSRGRNDAYDSAMQQSIAGGGAEGQRQQQMGMAGASFQNDQRQRAIAEQMQKQGWTLNALNSAISGQQVGMPQMPGFNQAGQAQAPQYMQAAGMQYGADMNGYNANQMGIQGLMQGGMSLAPLLFSDERLKTNITRTDVEVMPGVPLAIFEWKEFPGVQCSGVIAQDVQKVAPELVHEDPASGYLMVNYAGLGV